MYKLFNIALKRPNFTNLITLGYKNYWIKMLIFDKVQIYWYCFLGRSKLFFRNVKLALYMWRL